MTRGARAPRRIEAPIGVFDDFRAACGNAFGGLDQKVAESLWDSGHYPTVPVTRGRGVEPLEAWKTPAGL